MRVSATQARRRFGSVCAAAKRTPAFVERAGQIETVILSIDVYRSLSAARPRTDRPALEKASRTLPVRREAFDIEFAEWIAAQNAWVDANGIPGADLRPW